MSLFRKGVKVGKYDVRTGISKKRGQGILRKLGILEDDKGRKKYEKDSMGEVQTIRSVVARGEGFQLPVNFKVEFKMPLGIEQPIIDKSVSTEGGPIDQKQRNFLVKSLKYGGPNKGQVKPGTLDWKTHIMNNSTNTELRKRFMQAAYVSQTLYKPIKSDTPNAGGPPGRGSPPAGPIRSESKLNLYCSKVSIPDKTVTTALPRQYGAAYPWPTGVTYGTLTTTFYCDGTMHIKNYFDVWQKLIYNDLTGNFNFYNEYTSEFDVFARASVAGNVKTTGSTAHKTGGLVDEISGKIKDATKKFNEMTGVDGPRDGNQAQTIPVVTFRETYGVRIFDCFPQTVGGISFDHGAVNSIATFDVTWSYLKWNPFKLGNIGNRSTINLAIGEFRNEKDGFPFLEDLPEELSGPLSSAVNQGVTTGPMSNFSNLLG